MFKAGDVIAIKSWSGLVIVEVVGYSYMNATYIVKYGMINTENVYGTFSNGTAQWDSYLVDSKGILLTNFTKYDKLNKLYK
jgi:hypothetical protein